jgi:hypothetical protein
MRALAAGQCITGEQIRVLRTAVLRIGSSLLFTKMCLLAKCSLNVHRMTTDVILGDWA